MTQKVYNLIILDASGSMISIRRQAIDGVNETIQTIKSEQAKNPDMKQFVSFVSFNSYSTNTVYDRVLANQVTELRDKDYVPKCATPLYDAIGSSVTNLRNYVEKEDAVLVTIITDGYENASREFAGEAISKLIGELREHGWVFTYIGANQDVEKVAKAMHINNYMAYASTSSGTKAMFEQEKAARSRFMDRLYDLKQGKISKEEFDSAGYFDKDDETFRN